MGEVWISVKELLSDVVGSDYTTNTIGLGDMMGVMTILEENVVRIGI